jgi:prophage regulatory protein
MRAPIRRMLRRREIEGITGLSRSAIYDLMTRGLFPRPVTVSRHFVAWLEDEIAAWQRARIRERNAADDNRRRDDRGRVS